MKDFFKKYKYLFLLILISLVINFRWLSFDIFAYSDYSFRFSDTLKEAFGFSMWNSYGIGDTNLMAWRLLGPENIIYSVFSLWGFDSNIADKFLLFWPLVILSAVASYCLVRKITKSNVGGIIGSFVFCFNTYFLASDNAGHLLLPIAFTFAAFSLLCFIKLLDDKKSYLIVLTALSLFVTASFDLRSLYIILAVLFLYALYFLFFIDGHFNWEKISKNILSISLPVIIFLLLSVFWILATFKMGALIENSKLNRSLFGNSFFDITKSITLFHPFWFNGKIDWFVVQQIPFYFWFIPIIAFLGLILNRKNKNVLFFGLVSLLGIFLSKQIGEPLGFVYQWLFENFPGFNAFREATKFYFLIALGYSVLIGAFVAWLWENWNKQKWKIYAKYFLTFLIYFIFLWNTKPIITGEIGSMFVPRNLPQDYLILKDFILNQNYFFRTFWVPRDSRWGIYVNNNPKISNVGIIQDSWSNFINLENKEKKLSRQEQILDIYSKNFSNNLFDATSVKYVIVTTQDISNDGDLFIYYGGKENPKIREWYISKLDKIDWLKKIDIGTKDLVVYENENYRPHIYVTKEKETIYWEVPYEKVEFEQKNPTQYKISLKNLSLPVYLNFSESFHPDWKLRAGDFNWLRAIMEKNYFLPDDFHAKNNANLNSFKIDPEFIKQNYPGSYTENPDGSINLDLTLYFKPQSYFYLGLIISSATLVGCLGYLAYDFSRRKRKNFKGEEKSAKAK